MDTGTGIALAGLSFSIVMLIYRIMPPKNPVKDGVNGNGHCREHSGMCEAINNFSKWLEKVEAKLDRIIEHK